MDKKAFLKYLAALLLFGLNGIVAGHIALNSYEIVFLRTLIGSILLIGLFLLGKGKFHSNCGKNKKDIQRNNIDTIYDTMYNIRGRIVNVKVG